MKKILPLILAAALILGFIDYREKNKPKNIENNDQQIENRLDQDTSNNISENNIQNNNIENQTANVDNNDIDTGIEYVKNNDFNQLSDDEKANLYTMATNAIEEMGYGTSDFSYEDLNYLYNACQNYMIENNVDANSLSIRDQAKLYNILRSYLKNKN